MWREGEAQPGKSGRKRQGYGRISLRTQDGESKDDLAGTIKQGAARSGRSFYQLFGHNEFILPGTQADLFCLFQAGAPL